MYAEPLPDFVRAHGGVELDFAPTARGTQAVRHSERGGYRVRFPRTDEGFEAVLINTGGGMAGGDEASFDITLQPQAEALATTQAAEKIYRSQGSDTRITTRLDLAAGARLAWLPQETILFEGARLSRSLHVAMAQDAELTLCEMVFFGRAAMGEALRHGTLRDRWRIRRGGALIFAEDIRLEGALDDLLNRPALGGGLKAIGTILHIAPGAESRLDDWRPHLGHGAATALPGLLLARFVGDDAAALRADIARAVTALRGKPMPRSWQT